LAVVVFSIASVLLHVTENKPTQGCVSIPADTAYRLLLA
jgi:L,D-peptidoglycan transpeptidase YkuD (ErfK/YbiS/YcfS/YnhG family)